MEPRPTTLFTVDGLKGQVLCITHLPQVARLADAHFLIEKQEIDGRTFTHVAPLEEAHRRSELTRILGADTLEEILI